MSRLGSKLRLTLAEIEAGALIAYTDRVLIQIYPKKQVSELVYIPDIEKGQAILRDGKILSMGTQAALLCNGANPGDTIIFIYRPTHRMWDSFTTADDIEIIFTTAETILVVKEENHENTMS